MLYGSPRPMEARGIRGHNRGASSQLVARSASCLSPVQAEEAWRITPQSHEANMATSSSSASTSRPSNMHRLDIQLERIWAESISLEALMASTSSSLPLASPPAVEEKPPPSVPPQSEGPKGGGDGGRSPDYFANVGDAIRTLRDDIPKLFEKDLNCESHSPLMLYQDCL